MRRHDHNSLPHHRLLGVHKTVELLSNSCVLGAHQRSDKIRSGYVTYAFLGAQIPKLVGLKCGGL